MSFGRPRILSARSATGDPVGRKNGRWGPQAETGYAGYVAWRGMVPEASLSAATAKPLGEAITYYVYANSHLLAYPIPAVDGSVEPGERLINFVWYRNYSPGRSGSL